MVVFNDVTCVCAKMLLQVWSYNFYDTVLATKTTVKILKIGTPKINTIIVLQMEQLDFTVQYCVQKMQTE